MKGRLIELFQLSEAPAATNWIQIMRTGKWQHPKHGDMEITVADLHKFKENFDSGVRGVDLFVDVAHKPDDGAVAKFEELKVVGDRLMTKVTWTEEGAEMVKSGKYRYFSPEFAFQYTDPESGKKYQDVLFGGALTNRPFIKNMQPIALSEDSTDEAGLLFLSDEEPPAASGYDPDGDGDDDSTTDPKKNPDWMQDVLAGITPWPSDPEQQAKLTQVGASKEACAAAYKVTQAKLGGKGHQVKMAEDDLEALRVYFGEVANPHKSPPKGKPADKSQYADPENYKYPIDDKHIQSAVNYYNHDGMQSKGGYSDTQWAPIGHKIAAAANKHLGSGYALKNGKIETPTNHSTTKMDEDEFFGTKDTNPEDGTSASGPPDDTDAGNYKEPKAKGGVKMNEPTQGTVSLSEFQAEKDARIALEKKLRHMELSEKVNGYVKAGKLAPAESEKTLALMESMTDDQVKLFEESLEQRPTVVQLGEVGHGRQIQGDPHSDESKEKRIVALTEKYVHDGMDYRDAFIRASEEVDEGTVK